MYSFHHPRRQYHHNQYIKHFAGQTDYLSYNGKQHRKHNLEIRITVHTVRNQLSNEPQSFQIIQKGICHNGGPHHNNLT